MLPAVPHALVESHPHRRAGPCGSGALRDLLELHGVSCYLVERSAERERGLCSHLGIELDLRQTDDVRTQHATWALESPSGFRSLPADFLHEAARLLDDDALAVAGGTYSRLSEAWIRLAAAAGAEKPGGAIEPGIPLVEEIGRLEHEGAAAMERRLEDVR